MAITKEHQEFIERVGALAAADMKKSGVLASLTIAQAILESGWGKSGLTVKALRAVLRALWRSLRRRRRSSCNSRQSESACPRIAGLWRTLPP